MFCGAIRSAPLLAGVYFEAAAAAAAYAWFSTMAAQ